MKLVQCSWKILSPSIAEHGLKLHRKSSLEYQTPRLVFKRYSMNCLYTFQIITHKLLSIH